MTRTRYSLQYIENQWTTRADVALLENLIRAFAGIQAKDPNDPNSFWVIAGYHGEPFRAPEWPGKPDPDYWGGYCNHGNVLFPLWHRAYCLRLENALRSVPGCQDVTLPFLDETFLTYPSYSPPTSPTPPQPLPSILTSPTFQYSTGETITNPLYSYTLQQSLIDGADTLDTDARYSKPQGYQTCRYPQSGLVGNDQDRAATQAHNQTYSDPAANAQYLNNNVFAWLTGSVNIPPDPQNPGDTANTNAVTSRFLNCLKAPNYTVFSNTTSQKQWIVDNGQDPKTNPDWADSLESPHNAIHLSLGGFFQPGEYNADPISGANGDMGDNETAGFDPIFFLHHCFIDYVFWTWQKINSATSQLEINAGYAGTIMADGLPTIAPKTPLDLNTHLDPFKQGDSTDPNSPALTGADIINIEQQLDYIYGPGSLDSLAKHGFRSQPAAPIVKMKTAHNINKADYPGSFVIRTYASGPGTKGKTVNIGWEAILSRWNIKDCENCKDKLDVMSHVPIDQWTLEYLTGRQGDTSDHDVEYSVRIQGHDSGKTSFDGVPLVDFPSGRQPIVSNAGDLVKRRE